MQNNQKDHLFKIDICIPFISKETSTFFYKSLREASLELNLSYYFLYNCYHDLHHNQFSVYFKIIKVPKQSFKQSNTITSTTKKVRKTLQNSLDNQNETGKSSRNYPNFTLPENCWRSQWVTWPYDF